MASPTLEDVARAAGVSRATVSRVINGIRNVDPSIQEAVRRAIAEVGYVPNRAARQLVTGKTGSIALVVSGAGQFFARLHRPLLRPRRRGHQRAPAPARRRTWC